VTPLLLKLHRWLGLVFGGLVLIAAVTAVALNHQDQVRRWAGETTMGHSPFGRGPRVLAVDPGNPRAQLAGTDDGLFRSEDGGLTWEEAVLTWPAENVVAIQFTPGKPDEVHLALAGIGILHSLDRGETWEDVALPFQPVEGVRICGLATDLAGHLVVLTRQGTWIRDAVGSWTERRAPGRSGVDSPAVQLAYQLHDGRFWGSWGIPLTDGVSVALIVLVATGYGFYGVRLWRRRATRLLHSTRRGDEPTGHPAPTSLPGMAAATAQHP
jgi:hypothetical protein